MARKLYTGKDVDISFDAAACEHSGICVKNLPGVFDTKARPWIQPDGAAADDVVDVVGRCPSGALRVERAPTRPAD